MKKNTIATATVLIVAMGIFIFLSRVMPSFNRSGAVGPGFAPRIYLYGGILSAVAIISRALYSKKQKDKAIHTNNLVIAVMIICAVYSAAINFLGYNISTFAALIVLMRILGVKRWPQIIGVTIGFLIVIYLVFVVFLSIPIPTANFLGGVI
jgi:ABC-type Fe3+-siderophore transport system permease subunit